MRLVTLLLALCYTLLGQETSATKSTTLSGRLSSDTSTTTLLGNRFIAPKDWSVQVKDSATVLEAPEGGSYLALVDVNFGQYSGAGSSGRVEDL